LGDQFVSDPDPEGLPLVQMRVSRSVLSVRPVNNPAPDDGSEPFGVVQPEDDGSTGNRATPLALEEAGRPRYLRLGRDRFQLANHPEQAQRLKRAGATQT